MILKLEASKLELSLSLGLLDTWKKDVGFPSYLGDI